MLRAVLGIVVLTATFASANPLDHFRTDDVGPHKVPHVGTVKVLVIPTRVADEFPSARWEKLKALYNPEGGPNTFRGYWQAVSNGAYDPIPVLAEPILFEACPLPDRAPDDCTIALTDLNLLTNGGPQAFFGALLETVRDDQGIDLAQFDTTGAEDGVPDGYFDGMIVDSDLVSGVGLPLAALTVPVKVTASNGAELILGNVSMAPPDNHEFGHILGFIDLYNGPSVNDVMGDFTNVTLSAYSRQQIGWGNVEPLTIGTHTLKPVMEGGTILRLGEAPRYILLEHRGGAAHADWDRSPAGIYAYAVDESALPTALLGFLNIPAQSLYYPNNKPPYLNISLPLDCIVIRNRFSPNRPDCVLEEGGKLELAFPGEESEWSVRVMGEDDEGRLKVEVTGPGEAPAPPVEEDPVDAGVGVNDGGTGLDPVDAAQSDGGGCQAATGGSAPPWFGLGWLGVCLVGIRRWRLPNR